MKALEEGTSNKIDMGMQQLASWVMGSNRDTELAESEHQMQCDSEENTTIGPGIQNGLGYRGDGRKLSKLV